MLIAAVLSWFLATVLLVAARAMLHRRETLRTALTLVIIAAAVVTLAITPIPARYGGQPGPYWLRLVPAVTGGLIAMLIARYDLRTRRRR